MADVQLIHGDCLEILSTLAAGSVDAIVADPPYGISQHRFGNRSRSKPFGSKGDSNRGKARIAFPRTALVGDDKPFDPAPWLAFPIVCLWGANHYADKLPAKPSWLVWDKRDGRGSDDFSDCEFAWTNTGKPARLFHHYWRGMLRASEVGIPRVHPTQKPIALMKWVLDTLKIPAGATVLDPFMGSGTTGVACVQTGRNFIGIEIDEGYFCTAVKRIAEAEKTA